MGPVEQPDPPRPQSKDLSLQSDAELIQALRTRHHAAFDILYDRYSKLVYSATLKILNNTQEAEEVTQDVFVTLWRRDSYNPDRGSLSSFFCLLSRARAIDKLRSRGTGQKLMGRWQQTGTSESAASTPFEKATTSERQTLVRQALTQLPDIQRQVLEMVYYTGISQNEIAKQLNVPLGTVKSRSRQGLLKLGQHLQNLME